MGARAGTGAARRSRAFVCACLCMCARVMIYCSSEQRRYSEVQWDSEGSHSFVNLNGFMHHALREPADQSAEERRTLPRGVFNGTAGLLISRGLILRSWVNAWLRVFCVLVFFFLYYISVRISGLQCCEQLSLFSSFGAFLIISIICLCVLLLSVLNLSIHYQVQTGNHRVCKRVGWLGGVTHQPESNGNQIEILIFT